MSSWLGQTPASVLNTLAGVLFFGRAKTIRPRISRTPVMSHERQNDGWQNDPGGEDVGRK